MKEKKKNERCPIALKLEGNKMKSKAKIKKKKRIRVLHQKCVSHTVKPVLILNIKP